MEYTVGSQLNLLTLTELFTAMGNVHEGKTEIIGRSRAPRATLARPLLIAMLSFGSTASLSLIQLSLINENATSQPRTGRAFDRLPSASKIRRGMTFQSKNNFSSRGEVIL